MSEQAKRTGRRYEEKEERRKETKQPEKKRGPRAIVRSRAVQRCFMKHFNGQCPIQTKNVINWGLIKLRNIACFVSSRNV